ncbi:hypothetical protein TNIN_159071 [Trichonephila inaurata madagascariensis]|uniref:Mediator of RNA polymerase II transcription subunit 15 n=1 Tax=Trichonephila inaurata madagascariensis TaxID=2747483 RepID=A0A8X6XZY6_9ARAC|nr:hypothetical protein TNIN_159071 [Trichonephila inaurata madagascariensis]
MGGGGLEPPNNLLVCITGDIILFIELLELAIEQSGKPTTESVEEMEEKAFQKAKTREEYIIEVGRVLMHVRGMSVKGKLQVVKANRGSK